MSPRYRRPRSRLRLDHLEARITPTVFNIANGDVAAFVAAVNVSNTNNQPDVINLAAGGTYTFTARANSLAGGNALPQIQLDGGDAENSLTINGNGATVRRSTAAGTPTFRFMMVGPAQVANGATGPQASAVFVSDLTMTNFDSRLNTDANTPTGGAMLIVWADVELITCTITGNFSQVYGAINDFGERTRSFLLEDCTITNNTGGTAAVNVNGPGLIADLGTIADNSTGGLVYGNGTDCIITGTTIRSNRGIGLQATGSVALEGVTVTGQTRTGVSVTGTLDMSDCTVAVNGTAGTSPVGGVIVTGDVATPSALTITNCTIDGNLGNTTGGVSVSAGSAAAFRATITNSTITGNRSTGVGGVRAAAGTVVQIGNTVVAGNTGPAPDLGTYAGLGYNFVGNGTGSTNTGSSTGDQVGTAAAPLDPMLAALGDNGGPTLTRLPSAGSPLLNAGDPAFAPPPDIDQRGLSRVANGRIDIGAVEVSPPDLVVTIDDGRPSVPAGGQTVYTAVVKNAGDVTVTGATFTVPVPAGATFSWTSFADAGASGNTTTGGGAISDTLTLAPRTSVVYIITVDVSTMATGSLTVTATATDPTGVTDVDPSDNTDSDTDLIGVFADLNVTVDDGVDTVTAGDGVLYTYTITVTNSGPEDAANVSVSDTWPAAFSQGTVTNPFGTVTPGTGGDFVANLGTIASGGSATITVTFSVPADVLAPAATNTAVVTSDSTDPDTADNTFDDTDTILISADLGVTVDDGFDTVIAGDGIVYTYTITVTNNGPSDAQNVLVADTWPTLFNQGTVTNPFGAVFPGTGGDFVAELGTIAAGGSASVTVTFTVSASTPPLDQTNTVTVISDTDDPDPFGNTAGDTDTIETLADLRVAIGDGVTSVTAGDGVFYTYTVTVTNTGPSDAQTVSIEVIRPAGFSYLTEFNPYGPVTIDAGGDLFADVGTVAAGTSKSILLPFFVPASTLPGDQTAVAVVTSSTTDSNPFDDIVSDADAVLTFADLGVTVDDGVTTFTAGDGVVHTYTITVNNAGVSDAQAVTVTDAWPAGFAQGVVTNPFGLVTLGLNGDFVADLGTIAAGDGKTITVTYTVPESTLGGDQTNTVTVTSTTTDDAPGNETAADTDRVRPRVHVIATGAGTGAEVRLFNARTGALIRPLTAYPNFGGGVRVAVADFNADGTDDLVTVPGPGGGPHVKVFDGVTGRVVREFMAYDPTFTGGVSLAVGDVNKDGVPDIITGAGPGGGPHVRVFDGVTGQVIHEFFAYAQQFTGGITVAAGDVDGDGVADVITGAGPGGGPHVQVFSGATGSVFRSFYAYFAGYTGGVNVAAGDVNGDGLADIITGTGPGGGPHVKVFAGLGGQIGEFFAYDRRFTGGVNVATADLDGDGVAEVLTGPASNGGPHVRAFKSDGTEVRGWYAFDPSFLGGVFVG